jgi:hypothetical protein
MRCHGDAGGDERDAYAPIVWRCRYSGIEVPDHLWQYVESGRGRKYGENQAEHLLREHDVLDAFDRWTDAFADFVDAKGAVPPGTHRAFGYQPPSHRFADLKLEWRDLAMRAGRPRAGSSPAEQQRLWLNQDATWTPSQSEREKKHDDVD